MKGERLGLAVAKAHKFKLSLTGQIDYSVYFDP